MRQVLCSVIFVALTVFSAGARTQSEQPSGTIKGRITVDGKAQPGVLVSLFKADDTYFDRRPLANVITDADGGYRFTAVAAGRYSVSTYSPLFVNMEIDHNGQNGRFVAVDAGEAVEGIDITLARGGVITGRVTDAEGHPVIADPVMLLTVDGDRVAQGFRTPDIQSMTTDDRGIYRIYGVPPGKYLVKIGSPANINRAAPGGGRYSSYMQTFHPDVTEQSKATVVEVTPGGETAGVDIKVSRIQKMYVATGRMVEAETGRPVPNLPFGMGMGENPRPVRGGAGYHTNDKGEFRIEIATPARVTIFPSSNGDSNLAGDPFSFELTSERVTGLEVKLRRAQTISGIVVVEGSNKQPKFSSFTLSVTHMTTERGPQSHLSGKVAEDGSFSVGGIGAGKAIIYLHTPDPSPQRPWLMRVERNGADQEQGVEVAEGESISDLRLVVGYGSGVVRGQVKVEGRAPEEPNFFSNVSVFVAVRHTKIARLYTGVPLDARGRFVIEGLLDGEYELTLNSRRPISNGEAGRDLLSRLRATRQTVTVAGGAESSVTIPLDLSEKK